jgi:hypothetical protein
MRKSLAVAALAAVTLVAAVPGRADARIYVRIGPPAPVAEVRAVAPGPRHVWIPGYHRWDGSAYVWVGGRWDLPPAGRAAWVPGHWSHHHSRGWYWVEGHWR